MRSLKTLQHRLHCKKNWQPWAADGAGQVNLVIGGRSFGLHYLFPENSQEIEAVTFSFGSKETVLVVRDQHGEHQIACGNGKWSTGVTNLETGMPRRVAASGAWVDENTYVAILRFYETPFALTLNFRFLREQLFSIQR